MVGTKVEDVDGGPPKRCCRHVREHPPLKLKTSMADPLGVLPTCPAAATTGVEDVDVAAPEPTSTGRCDLKLQLIWQCMDACSAPCLDLEFVCGVLGFQGAGTLIYSASIAISCQVS
jgi:hypothetical protein